MTLSAQRESGLLPVHRRLGRLFRERRRELFHRVMRPGPEDRILDVGGGPAFWEGMDCPASVTCVNPEEPPPGRTSLRIQWVRGDGRDLPFADESFDIVFSNSTLQYAGDFEDQRRFADEIRRVGRSYWVQTPNRWFFVEPDLLTPFLHYLPKPIQRRLVHRMSVAVWLSGAGRDEARRWVERSRLLTRAEMRELFPDAEHHEERWLLMTKSFIACRSRPKPRQPAPARVIAAALP